jgi:predicted pyridoxine 5'-phosphate oxidase superfamily flavin-nucleotide-binding protein
MSKLTNDMKDLVVSQQCFVATVNPDGTPNLGPKRSTRVLDDGHLLFTEATGKRTWQNVQRGSRVAIAVVDRDRMTGYRFEGPAEVITSGPIFEQAAAAAKQRGSPASPKAVVRVAVERVFGLGGSTAGEEID